MIKKTALGRNDYNCIQLQMIDFVSCLHPKLILLYMLNLIVLLYTLQSMWDKVIGSVKIIPS